MIGSDDGPRRHRAKHAPRAVATRANAATTPRRCSALALAAIASATIAWAPDWSRDDWPRTLMAHACGAIAARTNASVQVECGANDVVAALRTPVDYAIARRMGAVELWRGAVGGGGERASVRVSVVGAFVIVEQTSCGACARVMGTTWVLRPPLALPSTLSDAQRAAGLRASPLLRTVDAWRGARP